MGFNSSKEDNGNIGAIDLVLKREKNVTITVTFFLYKERATTNDSPQCLTNQNQ